MTVAGRLVIQTFVSLAWKVGKKDQGTVFLRIVSALE